MCAFASRTNISNNGDRAAGHVKLLSLPSMILGRIYVHVKDDRAKQRTTRQPAQGDTASSGAQLLPDHVESRRRVPDSGIGLRQKRLPRVRDGHLDGDKAARGIPDRH